MFAGNVPGSLGRVSECPLHSLEERSWRRSKLQKGI